MAKQKVALPEIRSEITRVVRVAVSTNFNCTKKEWLQLDGLAHKYLNSEFFVNCNIKTPKLETINEHPYKAVITLNPDLRVLDRHVEKLHRIDQDKVGFVRVKYVPTMPEHKKLITRLAHEGYTVVVTLQRWNGKESLFRHTEKQHYKWSHNRFRLTGDALSDVISFVDSFRDEKVFICDRVGVGCGGCRLCSFLPTDKDLKIASVDLSSSGSCSYNCPDCYAKTMQRMAVAFGNSPLIFDKIRANTKQSGRSSHIKEMLKQLEIADVETTNIS